MLRADVGRECLFEFRDLRTQDVCAAVSHFLHRQQQLVANLRILAAQVEHRDCHGGCGRRSSTGHSRRNQRIGLTHKRLSVMC
jgi:hypothetical protein